MDRVWLGELPLLALIQLPKITVAQWLCRQVVMKFLPLIGLSRGSFSPDYILARPYALAIVYLIPMVIVGLAGLRGCDPRRRLITLAFFMAATIDYVFTLVFANGGSLAIY